jgi:hypothetical protein
LCVWPLGQHLFFWSLAFDGCFDQGYQPGSFTHPGFYFNWACGGFKALFLVQVECFSFGLSLLSHSYTLCVELHPSPYCWIGVGCCDGTLLFDRLSNLLEDGGERWLVDSDWIIIVFVIYIDDFIVEKIGGINMQGHFNTKSQFGKLGFETL